MDSLIKESGVGGGESKMRIGEEFQAKIPPLKEYTDLKAMGSVVKIDPTNSSAFEIIISGCTFRVLPVFKNGKVDWEYMKVKISSLFFLRFSEKLSEFPVIVLGKGESDTVVGKVVGLMEKNALCSYLNDCVEQDAFFDLEKAFELYNAESGSASMEILKASSRGVDGISSLPDEVLSEILALIPTKEAAVASLVSKKMRCAFNWRNTLDFDYTPVDLPLPIPRCQTFKAFVSSVLKAFCSPYLSKFTLRIGRLANKKESIPDLEPVLLNEWLHFPLTRDGVREIDLSIHVKQFAQLPQALFTRETLQVLKLAGTLGIDQVCAMPSFNLPNLKTLHLCYAGVFTDDSFLTRLVSSCPSLQDLKVLNCLWEHGDIISISSTSLRRLVLDIERPAQIYEKNSEHVLIDAPYLEYFEYADNLAIHYSITTMNALLKAEIYIGDIGDYPPRTWEDCFESLLSLLRGSSNASHLYLRGSCNEILEYCELKDDQLGVLHNLKHLELITEWSTKWDKILLDFLKRSPFLEILSFPKGLFQKGPNCWDSDDKGLKLERQAFSTTHFSSFLSHLKRIEIKSYQGYERELNLIKHFLACASILEDLVITGSKIDPKSLETSLKKLTRASSTCSIHVQ